MNEDQTTPQEELVPGKVTHRFQIIFGNSQNPPFHQAYIDTIDIEDIKEKIKPNVLIGAFTVLGTVETKKENEE